MIGFEGRFKFSSDHMPHFQEIARDAVIRVREATFEEDTRHATDLVVFTTVGLTHDQSFACRVRDHDARDKWPHEVTIRYQLATGRSSEWDTIAAGWADWMIYGFSDPDHYGRLIQFVVLNMGIFRQVMATIPFTEKQNQYQNGGETFRVLRLDDLRLTPGLIQKEVGVPETNPMLPMLYELPRFVETRSFNPGTHGEPRGPDHLLAGLCIVCGTATIRLAPDGFARHADCEDDL